MDFWLSVCFELFLFLELSLHNRTNPLLLYPKQPILHCQPLSKPVLIPGSQVQWVVAILAWPRNRRTRSRSTPLSMRFTARQCRAVCGCRPGMSAFCPASLTPLRMVGLEIGVPFPAWWRRFRGRFCEREGTTWEGNSSWKRHTFPENKRTTYYTSQLRPLQH